MSTWWMSYSVCVIRTAHDCVSRCFSGRLWPADWCVGDFSVAATHHYTNCIDHNLGRTCPGVAMCRMMASEMGDWIVSKGTIATSELKGLVSKYLAIPEGSFFICLNKKRILCPYEHELTSLSFFACSWKTSSRRTYALGWRKWREARSTPRRPPCWRWEPTYSVSRPSRRASWRMWKLKWAYWEASSSTTCPRVARRRKWKITLKTNGVRLPNSWRMAN